MQIGNINPKHHGSRKPLLDASAQARRSTMIYDSDDPFSGISDRFCRTLRKNLRIIQFHGDHGQHLSNEQHMGRKKARYFKTSVEEKIERVLIVFLSTIQVTC
jgi:hypothetical protein